MSIVQKSSEQDHLRPLRSSRHSYSILEFSVLTAFHTLSLLHFPLPHFQRPPPGGDRVVSYIAVMQYGKASKCESENRKLTLET